MLNYQFSDDKAIFIQIKEIFKDRIITSYYHPGERLPDIKDISKEISVNPNIVQKGFKELEKTGLIYVAHDLQVTVTEDIELIQDFRNDCALKESNKFIDRLSTLNLEEDIKNKILKSIKEALDGY